MSRLLQAEARINGGNGKVAVLSLDRSGPGSTFQSRLLVRFHPWVELDLDALSAVVDVDNEAIGVNRTFGSLLRLGHNRFLIRNWYRTLDPNPFEHVHYWASVLGSIAPVVPRLHVTQSYFRAVHPFSDGTGSLRWLGSTRQPGWPVSTAIYVAEIKGLNVGTVHRLITEAVNTVTDYRWDVSRVMVLGKERLLFAVDYPDSDILYVGRADQHEAAARLAQYLEWMSHHYRGGYDWTEAFQPEPQPRLVSPFSHAA
jgi:hypothetical protein